MKARWVGAIVMVLTGTGAVTTAAAQPPSDATALASRYVDPSGGVSLEEATTQALSRAPSLQATRAAVDVARGLRTQAGLRPNPSVSFEQRTEPAGMDRQTGVTMEWPLDLYRKRGRTRVADGEIRTAELEVADRERLLIADVRARYGDVLAAVRELVNLDELVATTTRQHVLLRARVEEGASPPLDRDLVELELRRLESDRAVQVGWAEVAMIELKRTMGLAPDAALRVRDGLEDAVARELSMPARAPATESRQRADVQQADARIGIAEARIDQLRREARVDVSVFASYMRMNAGFPQSGLNADHQIEPIRATFNYVSVGATVTLPFLNRNQGELAAARAARVGAVAVYDAVRLAADAEAAAARAQAAQADIAVALYRDRAGALARRNLSVVTQSYEFGRVTVFDVLAEQRRFFDVERAYTAALRAAYEARTALMRAVGGVR